MKKRDLLFSLLLTVLAFLAIAGFHNFDEVRTAVRLIKEFHRPKTELQLPATPYVLAFLRIALFYLVAAAVVGAILAPAALLLAAPRPKHSPATPAEPKEGERGSGLLATTERRRYWWVFLALLGGFLVYVHLRMITLYPALFRNSYRYAWFAGSSTWTFAVETAGRIAVILVVFAIAAKFREPLVRKLKTARPAWAAACLLALLALGTWGLARRESAPRGKPLNQGPNVIFIGVDSARPDHVSALGYNRDTTPHIDEFLKDAVRFDKAFVPLCRTYPSWATFLTACNPPVNGIRFDLPPRECFLPRVPTLAQHLKALGYSTSFFLNNTNYAWIEPELGFDYILQPEHNAVDFYLSHAQPKAILYYFFLNNPLGYFYERGLKYNAAYTPIYRPEYFDDAIVAYWRKMRRTKRFFAAIHFCNLHAPFSVNYPYSTLFATVRKPVFNRFTYQILVEEIARRKIGKMRFTKEEAERIFTQEVNLYDALLRSCDDSVGRVLEGLKRAGLYDNSLIVLLSDHGEHLFSNGLRYRYRNSNHGNNMWGDDDQHILLAIKFPHRKYAGKVVKRLVRSIDVAPTVLDALGLPPLEKAEGVSLIPYIEGRKRDMHLVAYAETGLTLDNFFIPRHLGYAFKNYFDLHYIDDMRIYKKLEFMPNLIMAKDRMVRDERWKLICYPIVRDRLTFYTELFDTAADPKNINDVSSSHPAEVKRLREKIWPYIEHDWKEWGHGLPAQLPVTTGTVAAQIPGISGGN